MGDDYTPGIEYSLTLDFIREHFTLANNSLVLYPKWILNEYTIIFDPNGGVGSNPSPLTIKLGDTSTIPQIPYSKTGNIASEWSINNEGTGFSLSPGQIEMTSNTLTNLGLDTNSTVTLYANWVKNQYSIQLVVNGKTTECTVTIDEGLQDPDCEPGFRFVGWFYKNDQGNETRFNDMSQMYDGMTLYAAFEPIKDSPIEMALCAAILIAAFAVVMFVAFRKQV